MDAHPKLLQRGMYADREGLGRRGDRARHPGGSDEFATSVPGAFVRVLCGASTAAADGLVGRR